MDLPIAVQSFWNSFQTSMSSDVSSLFYEAFYFGDNEQSAAALAALVLSGKKRATAGLLWMNESSNKPLPTIGALSIVTDWPGRPLCVIETSKVDIVPFQSVSSTFAAIEGEGDGTLTYWRDVHWKYFVRECQRIGKEPSAQMPIVCEQFRVVYPQENADVG